MSESKARSDRPAVSDTLKLWIGMLLAPIAWSLQVEVLYLTSEYGCHASNFTLNHLVSIAALVMAILGAAMAWRGLAIDTADSEESDVRSSRSRFMALVGVLTSVLFSLLIVAQWLPTLVGVPCDK
jgi:hypothetical protein